MEIFEKSFYFGIGLAALTKDKIDQLVGDLVEKGKLSQTEGVNLMKELASRGKEEKDALTKMIKDEMSRRIGQSPVATKEDIAKLEKEIAKLKASLAAAKKAKG